jgi:hypothetical protein
MSTIYKKFIRQAGLRNKSGVNSTTTIPNVNRGTNNPKLNLITIHSTNIILNGKREFYKISTINVTFRIFRIYKHGIRSRNLGFKV